MNIPLLRKIQKQILKKPKQFHMAFLFSDNYSYAVPWRIPNCGTAACIAGWALTLSLKTTPAKARHVDMRPMEAMDILRIPFDKADRLFYERNWPSQFQGGTTPRERAKLAVARIDHFIATKGAS